MALYAAYGSNLSQQRMARRAPASPVAGTGWLRDWRLTFGGDDIGWAGAVTTVVEDPGHEVFVMLYDMTPADEASLDAWEGADIGMWRKIRVRVHTLNGVPLAWLYVLDDFEGGLPTAQYLSVIADAAEQAGAPTDYVRALRRQPTRPGPVDR